MAASVSEILKNGHVFNSAYSATTNLAAGAIALTWSGGSGTYSSINTSAVTASGTLATGEAGQGVHEFPIFVTGISIQESRSVQPMFPLNGNEQLNIVGQASGSVSFQGLLTRNAHDLAKFLGEIGSACNLVPVNVTLTPFGRGCVNDMLRSVRYVMQGVTLVSHGVSIQSQGGVAIVNIPIQCTFSALSIKVNKTGEVANITERAKAAGSAANTLTQ